MHKLALILLAVVAFAWSTPVRASTPEGGESATLPKIGRVEAGLYGGFGFLSAVHGHYNIAEGMNQPFDGAAYAAGLRIAYFWPWRYTAIELEADGTFGTLQDDESQALYGVRAHLLLQGEGTLAPMFLVGVGGVMVRGEPLGDDDDPSVHWGVGLKYHLGDMISLRLEGRDIITEGEEKMTLKNKYAHHFQLLFGVGFAFLGE